MSKDSVCLTRPIFQVGADRYNWQHVLAASEFGQSLAPLLTYAQEQLTASGIAEKRGVEVDADELQQGVTELRYRLNLISAEETEDWLSCRHLTVDELVAFVQSGILRTRLATELAETRGGAVAEPDGLAIQLWRSVVLGQQFVELVTDLVRRVVAEKHYGARPSEDELAAARRRFCRAHDVTEERVLPYLRTCRYLEADIQRHLELDASWHRARKHIAAAERCQQMLQAASQDFVRLSYAAAGFASSDVAREVVLCVRNDGDSLADACQRAGVDCTHDDAFVDELEPELARQLLAMPEGDCAMSEVDGHWIFQLLAKTEPNLDDQDVYQRLVDRCVNQTLQAHIERDVEWLQWPISVPS